MNIAHMEVNLHDGGRAILLDANRIESVTYLTPDVSVVCMQSGTLYQVRLNYKFLTNLWLRTIRGLPGQPVEDRYVPD